MVERFKNILSSMVLKNSIWLIILQIFNTIIPLVTLPYITRVLGQSNFGYFSLALNWITYFQVIVEFGFAFTGARKVSIQENNDLQKLYSRIITARLFLFILSYLIMNILSFSLMVNIRQYVSMNILFIMILGVSFQLTWLFQGKQDMKKITIINAISRLISVIFVFILVKQESHLYVYCFCYSVTFIISAILGLILARKKYNLRVRLCSFKEAMEEIVDGWHLFLSQAMSKIFSGVGVTVLGIIAASSLVGVYSAIYKIPFIILLFFAPISQALYPYISVKFSKSYYEGKKIVKKFMLVIIPFFVFLGILIIILRKIIINIAFGSAYLPYADIIIPLVLWMVFSIINNFLGVQLLVASGNQNVYSKAFSISCIITIIANIFCGYFWNIYGIAFAAPIGEIVLALLLIICINKINKREVIV